MTIGDPKFPSADEQRQRAFQELRETTHAEMELKLQRRIKANPKPNEEELVAGAFREMIEPQVCDAMFEFIRKGYATESSGFGGEFGEIQAIDGYFVLDDATIEELNAMGITVGHGIPGVEADSQNPTYTHILFRPQKPDLEEIKKTWTQIASILPDRGQTAEPSLSGGSEDFRKQYAPERTDFEKAALKRRLAIQDIDPEVIPEIQKRIVELS